MTKNSFPCTKFCFLLDSTLVKDVHLVGMESFHKTSKHSIKISFINIWVGLEQRAYFYWHIFKTHFTYHTSEPKLQIKLRCSDFIQNDLMSFKDTKNFLLSIMPQNSWISHHWSWFTCKKKNNNNWNSNQRNYFFRK